MKTKELKKIIGSLMVVGFEGTKLPESCTNYLEQWDLGGVILFKRNIESVDQVVGLNQKIFEKAQKTPIVSVDHEGGRVFRLEAPFTLFPAMRNLGEACRKAGNDSLAKQVGEAFGRELKAAGFNLDYAPVLDVNSNPENPIIGDRAFGNQGPMVVRTALSFWEGLESTGVRGCGKHFPGHGDTREDSHLTLPVVEKSKQALLELELAPFAAAIQRQIPMLMTAHVSYPALDGKWPATLSHEILSNLLRKEMGFQGLIISDDMFMKGMMNQWTLEEASEQFFRAGGDLLLLCHQESAQRRVSAHLVHVAEKDSEFRDELIKKVERVERFRGTLSLGTNPDDLAKYSEVHQELAESFA